MPPVRKKKIKDLTHKELLEFFEWFDGKLLLQDLTASYTILGGAALLMLGIISRSTADIDLPAQKMEGLIHEAGQEFGIEIHTVTQCTTVDFAECPKEIVFEGKALQIFSIHPKELLKSKLERYQKQDPQDIKDILSYSKLSYSEFEEIFSEMLKYWVGHPNRLIMHGRNVVERHFPENAKQFHSTFKLSYE